MSKIISFAIQKGGVGKTTICINTADILAKRGFKILLIDFEEQANTSYNLALDGNNIDTIYDVILGKTNIEDSIIKKGGLDVIPTNIMLSDINLLRNNGKEYLLSKKIEKIKNNYDYILIDTSPNLNLATVNVLNTSNYVIIPCDISMYSLQGLGCFCQTIHQIKKTSNPNLEILGIILNKFSNRYISHRVLKDVYEDFCKKNNLYLFNTTVSESVTIIKAQSNQSFVSEYKRTKTYNEFNALIDEILEKVGDINNGYKGSQNIRK